MNNNIDISFLKQEHQFFDSLYDFHLKKFIEGEEASKNLALKSYVIAETLRAILSLSIEGDEKVFNLILEKVVPN